MNQLIITGGQSNDVVLLLHRNGTVDTAKDHFAMTSSDWGDDFGSVTITANATCSDGNLYSCETDSNSGEAAVLITVRSTYFHFI